LATAAERTKTATPSLGSRGAFRAFLRGQIATSPGDLIDAEQHASFHDSLSGFLLGECREAQRIVSRLIDPEHTHLGEDDPLVRRADACEIRLWQAFVQRARVCAGEFDAA